MPVPNITDIGTLYSAPKRASEEARWKNLSQKFESLYGRAPDFIARSPGRVNLIGEHIDYAGFGVLPMAIEYDCLIAVAVDSNDKTVKFANIDSTKYPTLEFIPDALNGYVEIDTKHHMWTNYFKAGYRGLLNELKVSEVKGMKCLMDGSVPAGGGLSSSSAFVCCSVLATMRAHQDVIPAEILPSAHKVAMIAIASEGYAGAMVGGMDQAASVLSKPQSALFIEFHPTLKVTPVTFPVTQPKIAFVIANTLVTSEKAVTAPVRYNLRVVETRGAARILAKNLGLTIPASGKIHLKQVLDAYCEKIQLNVSGKSEAEADIARLEEMVKVVEEQFGSIKDGVSYKTMCEMAGVSEEEFKQLYIEQPIRAEVFHLYRRTKHVYTEEKRVVEFRNVCEKAAAQSSGDASEVLFSQLGGLMNASQTSCHNLFDCSCDELEELTIMARKAGAYGSRLTGAGWGGASVSLVPENKIPEFIKEIKTKFYGKHFPAMTDAELNQCIFASAPSSGAAIFNGHL